jgi:hypothetical protein
MRNLGYYFRDRSLSDFVSNRIIQRLNPELKIFFIGFNKCATSAIFHFLARQGIKSFHCQHGNENLALEIERRLEDPAALKRYLMRWTAFSDLTFSSDELMVEGNRHFPLLHRLFPNAYFVLNDRDPHKWVASRMAHRRGRFARRSASFRGCALDDLPQIWMGERENHNRAVLAHFAQYPRFLHFRVDSGDVSKLVGLLAPPFRLKAHHWSRENVSAKRWPTQ